MASRMSRSSWLTEKAMNTISDHILDLTLAPGIHPDEKLLMGGSSSAAHPPTAVAGRFLEIGERLMEVLDLCNAPPADIRNCLRAAGEMAAVMRRGEQDRIVETPLKAGLHAGGA